MHLAGAALQCGMIVIDLNSRLGRNIDANAALEVQLRRVIRSFDHGAAEHRTSSAHVRAIQTDCANGGQNSDRG